MLRSLLEARETLDLLRQYSALSVQSAQAAEIDASGTPSVFSTQIWDESAVNHVREEQEIAYINLADRLKLKGGAKEAHAWATQSEKRAAERRADPMLGLGIDADHIPPSIKDELRSRNKPFRQRYADVNPPTEYQGREEYISLAIAYDDLQTFQREKKRPDSLIPLLATLASGEVNANISTLKNGDHVIFFERGLNSFLDMFATAMCWLTPPLSPQEVYCGPLLTRYKGRYDVPRQAFAALRSLFFNYVVRGAPMMDPWLTTLPHNECLGVAISAKMKSFVMAHELSHLELGHLSTSACSREQEFEADAAALAWLTQPGPYRHWPLAVWGCDLALLALHLLDEWIGGLAFGPGKYKWKCKTHPMTSERRYLIRKRALAKNKNITKKERAIVNELYAMTDTTMRGLAPALHATLLMDRWWNVRPSPLWSERISKCFASA
jgi:hypothetical protein